MSFPMNNRGLMERVVLEVGLDLGVVARSVFTMPVFTAVRHGPDRCPQGSIIAGRLPMKGPRLGIEGSSRWSKGTSRAGEG